MIPRDFRELSARIGRDPLQIQGPGGNTSFKDDERMWVKASGTELADAESRDIFVAVDLKCARAELRGEGDGTCRAAMIDPGSPIRPSIETTFHALLPQRIVVHTHSVNALAHLTSHDGTVDAERKLARFNAAAVPYAKPGLPLAREIEDRMTPDTQVYLLRNHGLIVAADTVREADGILRQIEAELTMPPDPSVDLKTDRRARGAYWPDHVVFLGPDVPEAEPDERNARLMMQALRDVLARVPPTEWAMERLSDTQVAELMDWDAETYRQKLAADRA